MGYKTIKSKSLILQTLRNTSIAVIYIFGVSQILENGDKLFGVQDNILASFVFLLLFSLSAAVVGGLVMGKPILLFLENRKGESIRAAMYGIGWLGIFTLLGIIIMIVLR